MHSFGGSVESADPQSPREQRGAVGQEKSVVHTSAPSLHPSLHPNLHCHRPSAERHQVMERMQARSEVLMRFARPRFPLCEPPTLLEPLCPSGASETLARTEWPAQQQRLASGLRNEVSVWRASSAAPGQFQVSSLTLWGAAAGGHRYRNYNNYKLWGPPDRSLQDQGLGRRRGRAPLLELQELQVLGPA